MQAQFPFIRPLLLHRKTHIHLPVIIAVLLLFTGCGIAERTAQPDNSSDSRTPAVAAVSVERSSVTDQLHSAHSEWEGTPYVLGGSGMNGIDCSALTQNVLRDFFGVQIPRHTSEQLQAGTSVRRQAIRPGDLIFFRTGRNLLHVGIALEGGDFLHASVSQGVMISNLSERYWGGRYLGARRVLD